MAFNLFNKRQSAPKMTTEDALMQMAQSKGLTGDLYKQKGALPMTQGAYQPPRKDVIDSTRIHEAIQILNEYKAGKANLDAKIVDNEQWYKLRHWEQMRGKKKKQDVEPTSAWLFNTLANKHADAMDNFPAPNILPREESDKNEAKVLTSIIPVILAQNGFKKTYSKIQHHKLRSLSFYVFILVHLSSILSV